MMAGEVTNEENTTPTTKNKITQFENMNMCVQLTFTQCASAFSVYTFV